MKKPTFTTLGHYLTPQFCHLCLNSSPSPLCTQCAKALPLNQQACRTCALPMDKQDGICGTCLHSPPPTEKSISVYQYSQDIGFMIRQFKEKHGIYWGKYLSLGLADTLRTAYTNEPMPQAIVPVPIHWIKKILRGYNQTELICATLETELGIKSIKAVKKTHHTRAQHTLSRKERLKNLSSSFAISTPINFEHVAVVDDVVTTGATVSCIAKLLKTQGVKRVDAWSLARTPSTKY